MSKPNERLINVGMALLLDDGGKRVTTPAASAIAALDYVIRRAMEIRRRLAAANPDLHLEKADEELRGFLNPQRNETRRGQGADADKAVGLLPSASQLNGGGEGQGSGADKARAALPDPSPTERAGEGQAPSADDGQTRVARPAVAQSPTQRGANVAAMNAGARSLLDSWRLREGRLAGLNFGDVRWADLPAVAEDHARGSGESALIAGVLLALYGSRIPPNKSAHLRDIVSASELEDVRRKVLAKGKDIARTVLRSLHEKQAVAALPAN